MKILVCNENMVQKVILKQPHVVISIQDPEYEFVKLPKNSTRLNCLQLKFHDIDDKYINNTQKIIEYKFMPFTPSHAQKILEFVEEYKNKVSIILVNCIAGVSRSAGVAGALSKILNGEDKIYFQYYIPNKYIYKLILNKYYETRNNTT